MTVFTIGYEGLHIEQFISLLKLNKIEKLIDVRAIPVSRKQGFSKTALQNNLTNANLDYMHMVELGCPKHVRDKYKEDNNWKSYTVGYNQYLKERANTINDLIEIIKYSNCALMCYEADYNFCHRSLITKTISKSISCEVKHIQKNEVSKTKSLAEFLQYSLA